MLHIQLKHYRIAQSALWNKISVREKTQGEKNLVKQKLTFKKLSYHIPYKTTLLSK